MPLFSLGAIALTAKHAQVDHMTRLRRQGKNSDIRRAEKDFTQFFAVLKSIKSKLIHGLYTDNPNQEDRNINKTFSWFLTSTGLNHPDRLGNAVMMSKADFYNDSLGVYMESGVYMELDSSYDSAEGGSSWRFSIAEQWNLKSCPHSS